MKLSILLPHKNRATLTLKTIQMYRYWLRGSSLDWEIIIADDFSYSSEVASLMDVADGCDVKLHLVTRKHEGSNAVIAFNEMALHATGNILLLSNSETFPANALFLYFVRHMQPTRYFVGACWALSPMATLKALSLPAEHIPEDFNMKLIDKWNPSYGEWYQHSEFRNRQLHFASLIMKEDYLKVGGMPEEFENSVGKEDVAFLKKVKDAGMQISSQDNMLFYHQNHYGGLYENGHDGFRRWNV